MAAQSRADFPAFFVEKSCEKSVQKQQDRQADRQPPAGHTGKTSSKKAGEKLRWERGKVAGAYASSRTGANGRNHAGRRRRLAKWPRRRVLCARYQVYTRAIYAPPYSPPNIHARAARHSCKITGQHHQHSRKATKTHQQPDIASRHSIPTAPATRPPIQPKGKHQQTGNSSQPDIANRHSTPAAPDTRQPAQPKGEHQQASHSTAPQPDTTATAATTRKNRQSCRAAAASA